MTMRYREVSNNEDILDSRDIIARIEELEGDKESAESDPEEYGSLFTEDDAEELRVLQELADEGEGHSDWSYGATLIRESYFAVYAQELADDICPSPDARDLAEQWPYRHIDWEAAAQELRMDYGSVEFDGTTYLIRY